MVEWLTNHNFKRLETDEKTNITWVIKSSVTFKKRYTIQQIKYLEMVADSCILLKIWEIRKYIYK